MIDIKRFVRPAILDLQPYSSARDEYKEVEDNMIFIDANENPFNNGYNRYPDPHQVTLKELIAIQRLVNTHNILLGNGSDEVLDLIFRAFCEPNKDAIITLPPTYGMYKVLAGINAIKNIEVQLRDNFQPNIDQILEVANTHTKLLFLCSPNNPTSNSFEGNLIDELLRKFNGIVVIDEAYIDFSKQESWVNYLDKYPNLIVTQTLSKAYGLAGIRLGICFASKEIIGILNKIKPPYNVNSLTQQKAKEILGKTEKIQREVSEIISERERLSYALNEIDFIDTIYPSDANFLLIKVDNADERYKQLIKKGIVTRNRSNQPLCKNCLRFTVGTKQENDKLINTLKNLS